MSIEIQREETERLNRSAMTPNNRLVQAIRREIHSRADNEGPAEEQANPADAERLGTVVTRQAQMRGTRYQPAGGGANPSNN